MTPPGTEDVEGLLRRLTPQVLGALLRRHGQFDACEDAIQEALLAAATSGRPTAYRMTLAAG